MRATVAERGVQSRFMQKVALSRYAGSMALTRRPTPDEDNEETDMKRILTAALLSSGILFAAGAAPASAEPGHGRGEIHRDGGFRDGGARGFDEVGYRHGWRHRHARRHCGWERVCFRNRWGVKRCHMERVCHPRWR
jgi:hypothetical protein